MMRTALALTVSTLTILLFVPTASGQAPTTTAAPPPDTTTDTIVVSRTDNTQTVEASDLRLLLTRQKREEHSIIRRLIFVVASLRLTEPAAFAGEGAAPQTCHWEYKSFLQRQQCFVSVTGVLACTQPEVTPLPEDAHGEAAAPANAQVGFCNDVFRPVVNARVRLAGTLRDRARELFAEDQTTKVDPLFKAAGVTAAPEAPAAAAQAPKVMNSTRAAP